jgi:hypothetical protein
MGKIPISELPVELQNQIKKENGVSTRNYTMSKDDVRSHSIAVLGVIKMLTKQQRKRVLNHALKVNDV